MKQQSGIDITQWLTLEGTSAHGLVLYMWIYMYIRDFPHVAVGGIITAIGTQVVGGNISISWVRHLGYGRKAAAHPELLREGSLFLWGFICLCVELSSYVEAKIGMFLLCHRLSFLGA